MSDSEILTKEAQVDTINKITKDQQNMIDACMDTLRAIKDGDKISEATLRNLNSVMRELDSLRELFYTRLFNSLKRGDMLLGQPTLVILKQVPSCRRTAPPSPVRTLTQNASLSPAFRLNKIFI